MRSMSILLLVLVGVNFGLLLSSSQFELSAFGSYGLLGVCKTHLLIVWRIPLFLIRLVFG